MSYPVRKDWIYQWIFKELEPEQTVDFHQVNKNLTWVYSELLKAKGRLNLWVESSLPGSLGQYRSRREALTMFSAADWYLLSQRSKGLRGPFAAL